MAAAVGRLRPPRLITTQRSRITTTSTSLLLRTGRLAATRALGWLVSLGCLLGLRSYHQAKCRSMHRTAQARTL